ncbi:MAG: hypothetical protein ACP5XB_07045 [Isosphaeraceae bacterium]
MQRSGGIIEGAYTFTNDLFDCDTNNCHNTGGTSYMCKGASTGLLEGGSGDFVWEEPMLCYPEYVYDVNDCQGSPVSTTGDCQNMAPFYYDP